MKRYRIILSIVALLAIATAEAQIVISGNVYGGGNLGKVSGNTSVTVRGGDIDKVFGGARMADIDGNALVHLDGEHAASYIIINYLFGGNDIAGTIGTGDVPTELTRATENEVDNTWNGFVRISSKMKTVDGNTVLDTLNNKPIYVGQLFGGGNGDYLYPTELVNGKYQVLTKDNVLISSSTEPFNKPEIGKTYLEILGGSVVYAFGGGNNATVTEDAVICVDNPSEVVSSIIDSNNPNADPTTGELLTTERTTENMALNSVTTYATSDAFQIGSFFGGNNRATMAIHPVWHLHSGKIRNIYSGGNEGDMTNSYGLLLEIPATSTIKVDNVYGGCRKANVHPLYADGSEVPLAAIRHPNPIYKFPSGLSARTLVRGGDINNVYGGNDITGNVVGGTAIGIYTSIRGDVYGGGNGSYAYTDNADLKDDVTWGDFYYNPGSSSIDSLLAHRPHVERVSLRLYSPDPNKYTNVGGSVYVGGNSATVIKSANAQNQMIELKIGSHVGVTNVFLGNNGVNMVDASAEGVLAKYAGNVEDSDGNTHDFSTLNLTDSATFARYMDGCAMSLVPSIVFDNVNNGDPADYIPYSTYIESLFCGGNVGSMTWPGTTELYLNKEVIIGNKLVAGCNRANVPATAYNAAYYGGILGSKEEQQEGGMMNPDGTIKDCIHLTLAGMKVQPKRWKAQRDANYDKVLDANGNVLYEYDANGNRLLEWNTISSATGKDVAPVTSGTGTSTAADLDRRFTGGNIYGGCYESGHVNGNVVINVDSTLVDRKGIYGVFDEVAEDAIGEGILYDNDTYTITKRTSGVILDLQGMDVLGKALNIFGGGYGEESEIWGSTTINIEKGYVFQVFGGGEQGAIGKGTRNTTTGKLEYNTYDPNYSTTITLHGIRAGVSKQADSSPDMAECEFIYGGGFEGPIAGNTRINLGNGRIFNSFAGSCNADILGHTETYMGAWPNANGTTTVGFPWVRDNIYGGNDLGGRILGEKNFSSRISENADTCKYNNSVVKATAYVEYNQGRVVNIFGGCYGVYDYIDRYFEEYTNADGSPKAGFYKPYLKNAFVNFRPSYTNLNNSVEKVFGAGQGITDDRDGDQMQDRSYVLVDYPNTVDYFEDTEVFGAGAFNGLGMRLAPTAALATPDSITAVIDLVKGNIKAAYGGSYEQGVTRRTMVNVPNGSTIKIGNIFGGSYGVTNNKVCDTYEANVNYSSADARMSGKIYGGNNAYRRTLYGTVNINSYVWQNMESGYMGTVYGAGYGVDTWSQYTQININKGAKVYEAYGGGELGRVFNKATALRIAGEQATPWPMKLYGGVGTAANDNYDDNTRNGGLNNSDLAKAATKGVFAGKVFNTNVRIWKHGQVGNYAYGGGLGKTWSESYSGDVYGTTYIELLGGFVKKDMYAAGTVGNVMDIYGDLTDDFGNHFVATANAYVWGGECRNVYGGGWQGAVGKHTGNITASPAGDILGETHVIIGEPGKTSDSDYYSGNPAVQRNAYGGGEGGPVYGSSNLTLLNGYVGYVNLYDVDNDVAGEFEEKLDDETWTDGVGKNRLYDSGCLFGGGYIDNSSVDSTHVHVYGGMVRNAVFGGGEIAAIGRGETQEVEGSAERPLKGIYKAGHTEVKIFEGKIGRNVFGGGRGYNNSGETGSFYTDGYVFGQTDVNIYGGEIGTAEGVALGYGNVFGGGDIGYVYSAYEYDDNGTKKLGYGKKSGARYDNNKEGYYYKYENGAYVSIAGEYVPTEDCKVLVEPHCKVKTAVTINGHNYAVGDFVPTSDLNTLMSKSNDSRWNSLVDDGIIIHNAVFAGGNVASGSAQVFANAITVFGNATASIHDIYHRDLITIGTGHTGGLYGDGNLTFVDGYRGLNITNYGTDYYNINKEISLEQYKALPDREAAYYELKYTCLKECTDSEGNNYIPKNDETGAKASTISADELQSLFKTVTVDVNGTPTPMVDANGKPLAEYWEENGVCSRYAGRIMNTIQRSDFCGVFGSRMVMQGAQDRVVETVDYTNYTINRVREVSLNKKISTAGDAVGSDEYYHGNYFGIYNIVNHLGALTSDLNFTDVRTSSNTDTGTYGPDSEGQTYYEWKSSHINQRKRNNGDSYNKVALASGVYLELTTEQSTGSDIKEKDWGYVTGIIELDLINVQPGVGGGFVYAKNVHGEPTYTPHTYSTLTALNAGAVTRRDFTYADPDGSRHEWETSGNFVHPTQIIIDDCYPTTNRYKKADDEDVPAHYWYIKGQIYVYEQTISAYTGSPNAYSQTVSIPLTITAASHGTMKLVDIKPSRYAYYAADGQPLKANGKIVINNVTYKLNDPISYWDWNLLSTAEKSMFVSETYVTVAECKIGNDTVPEGTVMLPSDYNTWKALSHNSETPDSVYNTATEENVTFESIFRLTNNLSHDTGYILTYDVNNPKHWNDWYTPKTGNASDKISLEAWTDLSDGDKANYNDGPTYSPTTSGLYGQQLYNVYDFITKETYDTYQEAKSHVAESSLADSAHFENAYLITQETEISKKDGTLQHLYPGAPVAKSEYSDATWTSLSGKVADAYICTNTIQLSSTEFIYVNSQMTAAQKQAYIDSYSGDEYAELRSMINNAIVPAYICTEPGYYGGDYYNNGQNYRGLATWCSMSEEDRQNFTFNYDALDVLIDPTYNTNPVGQKYQYDGEGFDSEEDAKTNKATYSLARPVDYSATYNGASALTYTNEDGAQEIAVNQTISREVYEKIPNEQHHYAPIVIEEVGTYYVIKKSFQKGETIYGVGQTITASEYNGLDATEKQENVTPITFSSTGTYYYCRSSYKIGEHGEGVGITSSIGVTGSWSDGQTVPLGAVIPKTTYDGLTNKQKNFIIHGIAPQETSTLYVSRESNIFDLSKEKIITVIYQYDYEESDESQTHITPISERHVVNIHVKFESGIPSIDKINKPKTVIPGTSVGMMTPLVTPGAYEVLGGGWELFNNPKDAENHTNGIDYIPNSEPLYWYQDGYYMAYYAKTYLGKTYSNAVEVDVANYHDINKVMADTLHHYYIDNPKVRRESKIYINDAENGISLLKDLYDVSIITSADANANGIITKEGKFKNHGLLDENVRGAANLEFFLRTDINHTGAWTPIASGESEPCFEGTLHGDGHTINGLSNSLFQKLCGNVFNLGMTGSFTGAGIAETGSGYVENCWTYTNSDAAKTSKPVFGEPSDITSERPYRIVNCYYQEEDGATNAYTNHNSTYGIPTRKNAHAFYDGEVAYNLNGFYLYKRYTDKMPGLGNNNTCFTLNTDNTLSTTLTTGRYGTADADWCSSGITTATDTIGYVEGRYGNVDFIYAGGYIPDNDDERLYVDPFTERSSYYPIWPDDYIFFGQALNYNHVNGRTHQNHPTIINKSGGRIVTTVASNRVYRAPAYFRSGTMDAAYYNPYAVFAQTNKTSADTIAYKGMTAIDFTGGNGDLAHGFQKGLVAADGTLPTRLYPPLLDDGGLSAFVNVNLTRNLLAYTAQIGAFGPSEILGSNAAQKTDAVISTYMHDEAYSETDATYRTVDLKDDSGIRGHQIQLASTGYVAPRDHLLVDKQDFNAPISYDFASGKRMWYQREPEKYVDLTKGWESISLPFTAEIVTTDQKGELTHFYGTSTTGHEYWLREYADLEAGADPSDPSVATFVAPAAASGSKTVDNTFLWDYYYQGLTHNHKDKNSDTYQTYYEDSRTYEGYPMLSAGVPYLIGFPGQRYYEFDLSGTWRTETTAPNNPARLNAQVITFASEEGATIHVSDNELTGVEHGGIWFKPNYLNIDAPVGAYVMNANGDEYNKLTATAKVDAFRTYFANSAAITRSITFSNNYSQLGSEDEKEGDNDFTEQLTIEARKHRVVVSSYLQSEANVRIFHANGLCVAHFTIQPGQTIETPISDKGIYIVDAANGRYRKKLAVR